MSITLVICFLNFLLIMLMKFQHLLNCFYLQICVPSVRIIISNKIRFYKAVQKLFDFFYVNSHRDIVYYVYVDFYTHEYTSISQIK